MILSGMRFQSRFKHKQRTVWAYVSGPERATDARTTVSLRVSPVEMSGQTLMLPLERSAHSTDFPCTAGSGRLATTAGGGGAAGGADTTGATAMA